MKINSDSTNKVILAMVVFIFIALIIVAPFELPPETGDIDFRPYWSSTYLLRQGDDFSDPAKMDETERALTGWLSPITMIAWFAPTGNLILLPYTVFSFSQASFYWLITNIISLFLSAVLIWPKPHKKFWIPLITTFSFSMTLISLKYGQVNTMVLLGLVLFLAFFHSKHHILAGISLVLTTVKPHLVILTLPILALILLRRKQWRVLVGFLGALMGSAIVLFLFNAQWPSRFWHLVNYGMVSVRLTPTLNGIMVMTGEYFLGKWLWVGILAGNVVIWWFFGKNWELRTFINISLIMGLIVSPIGWSYDQIMLLIPVIQIFEWITYDKVSKKDKNILVLLILVINGLSFYQRTLMVGDVWFFWLPILIGFVYAYAWFRKSKQITPLFQEET